MPWIDCPMCGGTGLKVSALGPQSDDCRNCQGSGRKNVSAMDRGK